MRIILTGAAGFIGFHVSRNLLARGDEVVGIDNFNDYYDPSLKRARAALLSRYSNFRLLDGDIADATFLERSFLDAKPTRVVHLAAQAGVRYSLVNPSVYVQSNLVGFGNVLESCRRHEIGHLVYASSSSVYGANIRVPFSVGDSVDHPVSLYAATKKANELMAHSYSHLFALPTTGLRYFTVYGPWGRPDMSPWLFTSAMLEGRSIDVFNHGQMQRDFTFIDDIAEGTVKVLDNVPTASPSLVGTELKLGSSHAPYRIYNIGNHSPVALMEFIGTLEAALGLKAKKRFLPMQPGDVVTTYADVADLTHDTGFAPNTTLEAGLAKWVDWYRDYHGSAKVAYKS